MRLAINGIKDPVDYINTHGTSTPIGDAQELKAIREVFGAPGSSNRIPYFNSTKSLTGHALGAAGVHEAIYTLMMMQDRFISASANVDEPDPEAAGMPLVTQRKDGIDLNVTMSNSFGFGGTNACLVFKRYDA
jgi:3-oxoacyl-[acyl-carrier-protein] synthase-1